MGVDESGLAARVGATWSPLVADLALSFTQDLLVV
jgi:hypothetical protein